MAFHIRQYLIPALCTNEKGIRELVFWGPQLIFHIQVWGMLGPVCRVEGIAPFSKENSIPILVANSNLNAFLVKWDSVRPHREL